MKSAKDVEIAELRAEVARLQQQIDKNLRTIGAQKKKLRQENEAREAAHASMKFCHDVRERLREENARLKKGSGAQSWDAGAAQAAEDWRALFEGFASAGGDDTYFTARYLQGIEAAILDWREAHPERMAAFEPARKFIADFAAQHASPEQQEEYRQRQQAAPAPPGIGSSPARLIAETQETDRAKVAERIADYVGKDVLWRGKCVETVDDAAAEYQVMLVCDGVLVEVRVDGWALGNLKGIKVGGDVAARGKIADISGNAWVGVVVRLHEASAVRDIGGWASPPEPPSRRR